jgi:hypothetical protein
MLTIIFEMPPGIALEIVGDSVAIISQTSTDSAAPKKFCTPNNLAAQKIRHTTKKPVSLCGGWLRQKLYCGLGS